MPTIKEKKKTEKTVSKTAPAVKKETSASLGAVKKKTVKKKVTKEKAAKKKPTAVKKETAAKKLKETEKADKKDKPYFEAVGRRKRAVARVRLFTARPFEGEEGKITVNGKFYKEYFPSLSTQQSLESSLRRLKSLNRFEAMIKVAGGGLAAQAEAIRHGLSRALVEFNPDFRKKLRRAGFLTRDPRKKERKKFGLKKARKSPQWSKR